MWLPSSFSNPVVPDCTPAPPHLTPTAFWRGLELQKLQREYWIPALGSVEYDVKNVRVHFLLDPRVSKSNPVRARPVGTTVASPLTHPRGSLCGVLPHRRTWLMCLQGRFEIRESREWGGAGRMVCPRCGVRTPSRHRQQRLGGQQTMQPPDHATAQRGEVHQRVQRHPEA